MPVGLGVVGVAVVFPGGDFLDEGLFVGNAAVEALGGEDAQFRLRQIEPTAVLWGVAPFEAFDQPPGFGGRKGFVPPRQSRGNSYFGSAIRYTYCIRCYSSKSKPN